MQSNEPRKVVWRNLVALMEHHWQAVELVRLAREARVSHATINRLSSQSSAPTVDMLQKLARVFRLQAWQLLDPRLEVATAELRALGFTARSESAASPQGQQALPWPFAEIDADDLARLSPLQRAQVQGFVQGLLASGSKPRG